MYRVATCKTNLEENDDTKQESAESTTAPSVETQPAVNFRRSRSNLETDACNVNTSLHLKSETRRVHSLNQTSISSALNYSRHFVSSRTDSVEEDSVSYDDTFDSLDSLSEIEDELSKTEEKTLSGNRSDSSDDRSHSIGSQFDSNSNEFDSSGRQSYVSNQSSSSGNRTIGSQLSSHEEKTSIINRSKSVSSSADDNRPYFDGLESISSVEGGIRSLLTAGEENDLPTLGLLSNSPVWSSSESISDQNITDYSVEDKFTSADGEIIYYSDFSIEALTARQYTQRSDTLEWSQNLKNAAIIPESIEFVQKKIQLLKRKSLPDELETPFVSSVRSHKTDLDKKESADLKDFCSKKLNNLKNLHTDSGARRAFPCHTINFYRRLKDDTDVTTYGIPFSVVQRLRIDMTSQIDFHESSVCEICRQKLGQLGLSDFLQSKIAIVREQLTNLKLNDARNASTYGMKIIGEILSEASCLNCKSELVMQRLLEPLAVHAASSETITQPA